jgi:hypothetical protein
VQARTNVPIMNVPTAHAPTPGRQSSRPSFGEANWWSKTAHDIHQQLQHAPWEPATCTHRQPFNNHTETCTATLAPPPPAQPIPFCSVQPPHGKSSPATTTPPRQLPGTNPGSIRHSPFSETTPLKHTCLTASGHSGWHTATTTWVAAQATMISNVGRRCASACAHFCSSNQLVHPSPQAMGCYGSPVTPPVSTPGNTPPGCVSLIKQPLNIHSMHHRTRHTANHPANPLLVKGRSAVRSAVSRGALDGFITGSPAHTTH